ncbi:MAG TPA: T9SS type A sorting domain-containing protein [Saprospiraceae bacterium]|nr:T9SS type A sorting domain-containing protein [Saprospiraceae bacterium]
MIKNQTTLLFCLLFSAGMSLAQQLVPFVVSSSGGFYNNTSGMLSFTTGEMAAIETYTSASNILTQGFQQPWDFGTYVIEHPGSDFSFSIYPNPSQGNLTLLTESEENTDLKVRISDLLGRQLFQAGFYHQTKLQLQTLDLSHVAPGIYFLTIAIHRANSSIEAEQTVKLEIIR